MSQRQRLLDWLHHLRQQPGERTTRWQRALLYAIDLPVHCVRELRHDRAGQMAAALTYHTLFSLLPTLVLTMVVLNAFVDEDDRQRFKEAAVEFIVARVGGHPASGDEGANDATPPDAERDNQLESGRQMLASLIQRSMDSLKHLNYGGIGLVGVLVFLYGATALLSTVERNFNAIFGVHRMRPWFFRIPLYYTAITLSPLVFLLGQWLQAWFSSQLTQGSFLGWFAGPWVVLSPLLATWGVMLFLYKAIPHTKVKLRAAAIGSLVATVLLLGFVELFRLYVNQYVQSMVVATVYGTLALLPLCLLWLYFMWWIVLFGLTLTHTLQAMKGRNFKHEAHRLTSEMVIDPAWAIPLAARIAKAFKRGRTSDIESLSDAMNLSPRAVRQLVESLEEANLIHVAAEERQGGYTLSRPADEITVRELMDAVAKLLPRPKGERSKKDPAWRFVQQLHKAKEDLAKSKTLADLAK